MGRRRHTPKQIITATSPPSVAPSHTQLSSSVLLVLSCGSEWGGAELGHEGDPR